MLDSHYHHHHHPLDPLSPEEITRVKPTPLPSTGQPPDPKRAYTKPILTPSHRPHESPTPSFPLPPQPPTSAPSPSSNPQNTYSSPTSPPKLPHPHYPLSRVERASTY